MVILHLAEVVCGKVVNLASQREVRPDFDIRAAAQGRNHRSIGNGVAGDRDTKQAHARNGKSNGQPACSKQSMAEYGKAALPVGNSRAAREQRAAIGQGDAGDVCPRTVPAEVTLSRKPSVQVDRSRRIESDAPSVAGQAPGWRGNHQRGSAEYFDPAIVLFF